MARSERDKREVAEDDGDGPIQAMLAAARATGLTLVGGTMPLRVPGETRVAPASLVYGPDGRRIGRYDKIHLFDVNVPDAAESHRESAGMVPGTRGPRVRYAGRTAGRRGVLRPALPGAVPRHVEAGRGILHRVGGLHACPPARRTGTC